LFTSFFSEKEILYKRSLTTKEPSLASSHGKAQIWWLSVGADVRPNFVWADHFHHERARLEPKVPSKRGNGTSKHCAVPSSFSRLDAQAPARVASQKIRLPNVVWSRRVNPCTRIASAATPDLGSPSARNTSAPRAPQGLHCPLEPWSTLAYRAVPLLIASSVTGQDALAIIIFSVNSFFCKYAADAVRRMQPNIHPSIHA